MELTVGSLFSGIGGFDLGLERAGWKVKFQVEIDDFCNKVLERHWPNVRRYRDIATVDPGRLEPVDLLCGGFPCQDLSVAGKRAGLAGSESSLFFEFTRIARALRTRWLLIENVPGLRSSPPATPGRDFAVLLSTLDELGYGVAACSLDSQYFGVAQHRARVFIVGHLGAPCPPEVLFEPASGFRNTPPSSETGAQLAPGLRARFDSSSRDGRDIAFALRARSYQNGSPERSDLTLVLREDPGGTGQGWNTNYVTGTVDGAAVDAVGVREAPGLPRRMDAHEPDGPRYRALGNAVTVPVAEWIGKRLREIDAMQLAEAVKRATAHHGPRDVR